MEVPAAHQVLNRLPAQGTALAEAAEGSEGVCGGYSTDCVCGCGCGCERERWTGHELCIQIVCMSERARERWTGHDRRGSCMDDHAPGPTGAARSGAARRAARGVVGGWPRAWRRRNSAESCASGMPASSKAWMGLRLVWEVGGWVAGLGLRALRPSLGPHGRI